MTSRTFTLDVKGSVLLGMQAEAAAVFSRLMSTEPHDEGIDAGAGLTRLVLP